MDSTDHRRPNESRVASYALAAIFFAVCTWTSYARWAGFEYHTFDLAYYVQGIWQLIHGRFNVTVVNVPLLGNHVEPIVLLFAPLFLVFRHPMLFVVMQNAALAAMAPIGCAIARRLGFEIKTAFVLSCALLIAPAAGFIALHEFHPEALTAPFILLMLHAKLSGSVRRHWLWFIVVLACKENMAPLLVAYCLVQCVLQRRRSLNELRTWYLWPMAVAIVWFLLCTRVITPALNPDSIDYLGLYNRLGGSLGEILRNMIVRPHLFVSALFGALTHGNLVWGLLVPFLCLPLLRPRWLIISTPILLQHLLSWRVSEWNIYFHYAAPLLPLFWIALVEALVLLKNQSLVSPPFFRALPWTIVAACFVAQIWLGPAADIFSTTTSWFKNRSDRARKIAFLEKIPAQASVVAPFPYLAHLAMREKLYSLHHILKGLNTLSRKPFDPPAPTDFVLIDYLDSATFDAGAGFYHPTMRTTDGQIVPSSDRLLHDFLRKSSRKPENRDELALYQKVSAPVQSAGSASNNIIFQIGEHTELLSISKAEASPNSAQSTVISLTWNFRGERDVFPWMLLRLTSGKVVRGTLTKGLCAPEAANGIVNETWQISGEHLAEGDYYAEAIFIDNTKRAWFGATGGGGAEATQLTTPIPLGRIHISRE